MKSCFNPRLITQDLEALYVQPLLLLSHLKGQNSLQEHQVAYSFAIHPIQKGINSLNPHTKKIFVSYGVAFHEEKFPLLNHNLSSNIWQCNPENDPFPIASLPKVCSEENNNSTVCESSNTLLGIPAQQPSLNLIIQCSPLTFENLNESKGNHHILLNFIVISSQELIIQTKNLALNTLYQPIFPMMLFLLHRENKI